MKRRFDWKIMAGMLFLGLVGRVLYLQSAGYLYNSEAHFVDMIYAKGWTILWPLISIGIIFKFKERAFAPKLSIMLLSAYFVILYGILFHGTEFGMHGVWGDNGNRLAYICKMMAFNTIFTDWRLNDLPAFYPPGWFALMAIWGKLNGIEAYQTIKFGYLFVYLVYPWLIFWAWKRIVSPGAAVAVAVTTIFFGYGLLDWISYEHMTAALFMPWWLRYFEAEADLSWANLRSQWKFYLVGSLYGAALFMTYYYWFFMAAAVLPITLIYTYFNTRSFKAVVAEIKHKTLLMSGVALFSAVYWLPLLVSIFKHGTLSAQNQWFGLRHTNLTSRWQSVSIEGILIIAGLALAFYLWRKQLAGRLVFLFLGGLILILIDRMLNLGGSSIQTRKLLEFVHVFAMAPLGLGLVAIWSQVKPSKEITRGLIGLGLIIGLIFANAHTENLDRNKYERGINQSVPADGLKALSFVDTHGTVFLTHNYLDACYLPYYQFITINNMSAHTAGRYDQRVEFLKLAATIKEPELLAYALTFNRYDRVNYVYLPLDKATGRWKLTLQQTSFNQPTVTIEIIFAVDPTDLSNQFVKRHAWGIYEVVVQERYGQVRSLIEETYPELVNHFPAFAP